MTKRQSEEDIPVPKVQTTQYELNNEFSKAVRERNYTVIKDLLDNGLISPNEEIMGGMIRPLIIAAFVGEAKAVKLLLEKGADLERSPMGLTPLAQASEEGNSECVQVLIDASANLDTKSRPFDQTCLMLAAKKGHDAVVYQLLMAGADKTLRDENGKTALDFAKENGNKRTIILLEMENFPSCPAQ